MMIMGNTPIGYIDFIKMHGAGNDYVYIDATKSCPPDLSNLAVNIADRHFGVGGDGLVVILPSDIADFRMRMFNADGSEAQMCGNASRCVGKLVYDRGLTHSLRISLETLAGIKVLHLHPGKDGLIESVTVDMGEPILSPESIPVINDSSLHGNTGTVTMADSDGTEFTAIAVSMGNPHAVIFIEDNITDRHINYYGRNFENHPAWPEKTNVEFVNVISPEHIRMRVWERGSGETLACGTGSCASVVAGILSGRLKRKVRVDLLGGSLIIEWDSASGHVFMTGGAITVADGRYYLSCGHFRTITPSS